MLQRTRVFEFANLAKRRASRVMVNAYFVGTRRFSSSVQF